MSTIVCKFGGSSLATAERIRTVADIVRSDERRRHIVVSAPGARWADDPKVTDLLRRSIAQHCSGDAYMDTLIATVERFRDIAADLGAYYDTKAAIDTLVEALESGRHAFVESRGEHWMAGIMAEFLGREFIDAAEIVKFQSGVFHADLSYSYVWNRLRTSPGSVIGGYYGSSLSDTSEIILFSRGGSDITGAIITRGLNAELYENWSDQPGFLSADPRIIERPTTIAKASHAEIRELAAAGATIIHPAALEPILDAGIEMHVRNTFDPKGPATEVVYRANHRKGTAIGVAGKTGFTLITLSNIGAYDRIGFLHQITKIFLDLKVPFGHTPDGFDSLSILVEQDHLPRDVTSTMLVDMLHKKLLTTDVTSRDIARVAIIGEGMAGVIGTLARAAQALANAQVNIITVTQSGEQLAIVFGIDEQDLTRACRALYDTCVERARSTELA